MREELEKDRITPGNEKVRQLGQQLIIAGECSNLPSELRAGAARHRVISLGRRIQYGAFSAEYDPHWNEHIVDQRVFRKRHVKLAAYGVDCAGRARHRMDVTFDRTNRLL